ncbi:blh [Symbiodinium sp. KB8]|nr:blh [Symbiodinium sp. KB8]
MLKFLTASSSGHLRGSRAAAARFLSTAASAVPKVTTLFHYDTFTPTYIVSCPNTRKAAVIDSVLDFDFSSGRISFDHNDKTLEAIEKDDLEVEWVLETHVHADHLTGSKFLREALRSKGHRAYTGIGERVVEVQRVFKQMFNLGEEFKTDGSQFGQLFTDGYSAMIGDVSFKVMSTPGHTPACVTYLIGDAAFVGDTYFFPDFGTARCDFPGGSAEEMYQSLSKLMSLPEETRLFVGHDYLPNGREAMWETTVGEQKRSNIHMREGVSEEVSTFAPCTASATPFMMGPL